MGIYSNSFQFRNGNFANFVNLDFFQVLSEEKLAKFMPYQSIDSLADEKQRGITISATHLEYETPSRHYGHVDCPGHKDYIKNMMIGTAQMDGAILGSDFRFSFFTQQKSK